MRVKRVEAVAVYKHDPLAKRPALASLRIPRKIRITGCKYDTEECRFDRCADGCGNINGVMPVVIIDLRVSGRKRRVAEILRDTKQIPKHAFTLRTVEHKGIAERPREQSRSDLWKQIGMHNEIQLPLKINKFLLKGLFRGLFLRYKFLIICFLIFRLREQLLLRRFTRVNRTFLDGQVLLERNESCFCVSNLVAIYCKRRTCSAQVGDIVAERSIEQYVLIHCFPRLAQRMRRNKLD